MSKVGNIGRASNGKFDYGNTFTIKLPYEYKLIRDAVKSAIYQAAAGLAMTKEQAAEYYSREDATLLENIFAKCIHEGKYDVLERFFDRIMGKAPIQMVIAETDTKTMMDELNDEQKRNAIEAASKTLEVK
jgi:hypothetical protein